MSKANILIVEDERVLAADLEDRLLGMSYAVCGRTGSGEQALAIVEQERPDLVIMDIRLEGDMDGIEASGQIKERFNIPVVFLTAFSDDRIIERAKVTEPFGYLIKPFQTRELRSTIEIALYKAGLEAERVKKEKLQSILEIAGAICHELNQPLQAVSGYSELVKLEMDESDPLYPKIEEIQKQVDRMGMITRKLSSITDYETKDYVNSKIIDLDRASKKS